MLRRCSSPSAESSPSFDPGRIFLILRNSRWISTRERRAISSAPCAIARSDFALQLLLERRDLRLEGLPLAAEVARQLIDAIEQHLGALLGAGDRGLLRL